MFDIIPLEIFEKILLYLSSADIIVFLSVFNGQCTNLSDYFWKTLCFKEDFNKEYQVQQWHECFQSGMNKKLGFYIKTNNVPPGKLEHAYLNTLITKSLNTYNFFYVDNEYTINLMQKMTCKTIQFKEEFIIVEHENNTVVYLYSFNSNKYEIFKKLPIQIEQVFGISSEYCGVYHPKGKCISLFNFYDDSSHYVYLPSDVKFLIDKILHHNNIAISVLSLTQGFQIKVFDIITNCWTLDLICFGSTGLTNDPNMWIGSNYVGCCDVSYRLRGIYFGPFKVWNKKGKLLFQADIEPSTKHFLHCFFKDSDVILTTSDNTVSIFNDHGEVVSRLQTRTSFLDIKISSGHLLFVLLEENNSVEIYDWSTNFCLYKIRLQSQFDRAFQSCFMYCPISTSTNEFKIIKFY